MTEFTGTRWAHLTEDGLEDLIYFLERSTAMICWDQDLSLVRTPIPARTALMLLDAVRDLLLIRARQNFPIPMEPYVPRHAKPKVFGEKQR